MKYGSPETQETQKSNVFAAVTNFLVDQSPRNGSQVQKFSSDMRLRQSAPVAGLVASMNNCKLTGEATTSSFDISKAIDDM